MSGLFGLIIWIGIILALVNKAKKKEEGGKQSQPNVNRQAPAKQRTFPQAAPELNQLKAATPDIVQRAKANTRNYEVEDESLLGSVEDLMVKGYDGNLNFERDFVGEAMDMINRFTLAD